MPLTDLVAPQAVVPALKVNSKKQAIQELAARAAGLTGQSERDILEILQQRERLGSTGIGSGIAIPHGKLPKLERLFGLFARLDRPIDFEALDGQPVDLIFLLLAPEPAGADHLKALARVARLMRTPDTAKMLRESRDAEAIYAANPASRCAPCGLQSWPRMAIPRTPRVARMERSEIRDRHWPDRLGRPIPHFASLHAGYRLFRRQCSTAKTQMPATSAGITSLSL